MVATDDSVLWGRVGPQWWALSPDGKRAVLPVTPGAMAEDLHLTFLLNFMDEFRRRSTPGK
jgi:hypothetical protein